MNEEIFETMEYKSMLREIGILNTMQNAYKAKAGKINQVKDYVKQIFCAAKKLSQKRELIFVDCACGRSYISFAANYVLCRKYNMKIKFICIDYNKHLIDLCKDTAFVLGYDNMEFICSDLAELKLDIKPDIVYCLHACDRATDMCIALGIKSGAQNILAVSCCQHTVKEKLKKQPLNQITRHGIFKERMADMLSDAMRALLLESRGYKTRIFEFTAKENTSKNIMLRAVKTGSLTELKSKSLICNYETLKKMFNTEPVLRSYIDR